MKHLVIGEKNKKTLGSRLPWCLLHSKRARHIVNLTFKSQKRNCCWSSDEPKDNTAAARVENIPHNHNFNCNAMKKETDWTTLSKSIAFLLSVAYRNWKSYWYSLYTVVSWRLAILINSCCTNTRRYRQTVWTMAHDLPIKLVGTSFDR